MQVISIYRSWIFTRREPSLAFGKRGPIESVPAAFLYSRQIDESEDIWGVLIELFSYGDGGQKSFVVCPRYSSRVSF